MCNTREECVLYSRQRQSKEVRKHEDVRNSSLYACPDRYHN